MHSLGVSKPVLVFSLVTFWQLSDVSKANSQSKVNGRSMKCTFSHRRSFGRASPAVVLPLNTCTQTTAALVMMSKNLTCRLIQGLKLWNTLCVKPNLTCSMLHGSLRKYCTSIWTQKLESGKGRSRTWEMIWRTSAHPKWGNVIPT